MIELKGFVSFFKKDKGFGFVWCQENDSIIFFHISDYKGSKEPENGDIVSFQLHESERGPMAKAVRLIEIGKNRKPHTVGVTSWVGPAHSREYGLLNHKEEKQGGALLHKTSMIDGSDAVEASALYTMDIAKAKENKYVALNARKVDFTQQELIEKLSYDRSEDPRVRLKALDMLYLIKGTHNQFHEKIHEAATACPSKSAEELTIELPFGIKLSSKSPSDKTVKITRAIAIAGTIVYTAYQASQLLSALDHDR